ncbi:MAG: hypothetical protein J6K73_05090 [Clostridia bacterium]|nr:hypothetical protein [Clostridia bacterium]
MKKDEVIGYLVNMKQALKCRISDDTKVNVYRASLHGAPLEQHGMALPREIVLLHMRDIEQALEEAIEIIRSSESESPQESA